MREVSYKLCVILSQLLISQFPYCFPFITPTISLRHSIGDFLSTKTYSTLNFEILLAKENEIPIVADLLSDVMFGDNLSGNQRKQLSRLELKDLSYRYGQLVGPRKYKSALIIAKYESNIVGCAGIDSQVLQYLI